MLFATARAQLEALLAASLPGEAAQLWMAPRPPRRFPPGFNPDRVRHAAGLLLLLPRHDAAAVVLTERAHTLDRHRGQISLPGGVIEPDETHEEAALREAHEEIGLDRSEVRILGALTSLDIPVSGFRLHPIIAVCDHQPEFQHARDEVARVLTVDLEDLMRPDLVVWRTLTRDGHTIHFPAFAIHDVEIWGATAMVLSEFLALFGWSGPTDSPNP